MSGQKKIAVIGASYLQLPVVEKIREMGHRSVCFAWADGAVCRDVADRFYPVSITEKEKILDICREERIDAVLTIGSDVAVPTVSHVAAGLGLVANSERSAYVSTNKFAMREALSAGGARCPAFAKVTALPEAEAAAERVGYPVVVKPCDRSGSMGVTKVMDRTGLPAAVEAAISASLTATAVLEKFVDIAHEISVEGISWKGKHHVLAITDKVTTGAPHYVELGQHQPSLLPRETLDEAVRQVKLGVRALGIEYGASHPELMVSSSGEVYVTEIGGRMGGDFIGSDLVRLSTGYDFLKGVVEVSLGEFTPPEKTLSKSAGVWFYAPETVDGIRKALERPSVRESVVRQEFRPEELKPLTRSADRAGYFIYQADSRIEI